MQAKNKKLLTGLGERLKASRERLGLNQSRLASQLNFSSPTVVSRFERGERLPSTETLIKLAELHDIDLHWLLTGQPAPSAQEIATERNDLMNKLSSYVISELKRLTDLRDTYLDQKRNLEAETPVNQIAVVGMDIHIYEVQQQLDVKMRDLQWVQRAAPNADTVDNGTG